MALAELAELQRGPDRLVVVLLGPGLGESVLLGVPPDDWLVVDSLKTRAEKGASAHPVLTALDVLGAAPAAVAVTHPHRDHVLGFGDVVRARRPGALVGCLPDWLDPTLWTPTSSAGKVLVQDAARDALSVIDDTWENATDSEWRLLAEEGPVTALGEATVQVLSPIRAEVDAAQRRESADPNQLSNAMMVRWRDANLLLGADLTRPGWRGVEARHGQLAFADASAFKVSHHGSGKAQHSVALGDPPARSRCLVLTPFSPSGVPSYDPNRDVDRLLKVVDQLLVTCAPGVAPSQPLERVRRADVFAGLPRRGFGPLTIRRDQPEHSPEDAWIALSIGPDGTVEQTLGGAACCVVFD